VKLALSKLRARVIAAKLSDWPRILPTKYRATPVGAGFGSSRYSSPSDAFRVLYAAEDFPTAFAEAVVRDRFEGKAHRYLYRPHLEQACLTAVSSSRELVLLDLRGAGAYELGVDTDASRARDHTAGQAFSQGVHDALPDVDAILFDSRLTTGRELPTILKTLAPAGRLANTTSAVAEVPVLRDKAAQCRRSARG
jgi:hypothetical protein